jgi:hypothetical protein
MFRVAPDQPPTLSYWWLGTKLSEYVIKNTMVQFLTPIVGEQRARLRVLSGCRGGGEMELKNLRAPPHVRATLGWWKMRLLSAEGAIVTYDGCSLEEMAEWTAKLGGYMYVRAPGVYSTTPPAAVSRCIRHRRRMTVVHATVVARRRAVIPEPEPAK